MCGIVGYIGDKQAQPILVGGLTRLEYRGYDSAGIVTLGKPGKTTLLRAKGKVSELAAKVNEHSVPDTIGIGHTRWATHGAPSDVNSHPQVSEGGRFAVVHNGIIENYLYLKQHLMRRGIESIPEAEYFALGYYERWLRSIAALMVEKGHVDPEVLP